MVFVNIDYLDSVYKSRVYKSARVAAQEAARIATYEIACHAALQAE